MISLKRALVRTLGDIEQRFEAGGVDFVGLPTGFDKFDRATGGLRKDTMYILGGRPGMGKSALALSMALNVSRQEKNVLYASFEMSSELISLRLLAGMTNIDYRAIENGKFNLTELEELKKAAAFFSDTRVAILDEIMTADEFIEHIREIHNQHHLDAVFVDYVGLFADQHENLNARMTDLSRKLRFATRVVDAPLVVLAQLNRELERRENKIPIMSDLRDSGSLEQDAAVVFFAHRPRYYEIMYEGAQETDIEDDALIIVGKNRFGPTGQLASFFYPKQMKWEQRIYTPRE